MRAVVGKGGTASGAGGGAVCRLIAEPLSPPDRTPPPIYPFEVGSVHCAWLGGEEIDSPGTLAPHVVRKLLLASVATSLPMAPFDQTLILRVSARNDCGGNGFFACTFFSLKVDFVPFTYFSFSSLSGAIEGQTNLTTLNLSSPKPMRSNGISLGDSRVELRRGIKHRINPLQLKVFGVKFSLREIGRIFFPLKYVILSFLKCLNYKI